MEQVGHGSAATTHAGVRDRMASSPHGSVSPQIVV